MGRIFLRGKRKGVVGLRRGAGDGSPMRKRRKRKTATLGAPLWEVRGFSARPAPPLGLR